MADRIIDANKIWFRMEALHVKLESLMKEYKDMEKWIIENTETF